MRRIHIETKIKKNIEGGIEFMGRKFRTEREREAYRAGAECALGLALNTLGVDYDADYISRMPEVKAYAANCTRG